MKSITIQVAKKAYQHSKTAFNLLNVTLLLLLFLMIMNQNTEAQQLVCPMRTIEQVTNVIDSADVNEPSINADGRFTVFSADGDLTGENPSSSTQVFLFDSKSGLTQITPDLGSTGDPSINADGTLIALDSSGNINGGNPEGNDEIYLFDTTTGMFTQITDEPAGDSGEPSINGDGTRIAFHSNANINGGNPEGNREIYLYDTTTGMFTQITDEPAGDSTETSINGDGTRIAFESSANINGGNPDGNREIYLYDTTTGMFTQITFEIAGNSDNPSINADGTRIAFHSDANINGGNPDGNDEIYLFDTTTGVISQITDDPTEPSLQASISANGKFIAFTSEANINGGNPEANREIYVFDSNTGTFTQVTEESSNGSQQPSINADGTRIAFDSNANITGMNPDNRCQLFLTTCRDPNVPLPIPTLSEWGLIAMAGALGIIGLLAIRRKRVTA